MRMARHHEISEPVIACPNCGTHVRVTESLAAPLIQATRAQYERKIAEQAADIANREAAIRNQEADLAKAKGSIDKQVAAKVKAVREKIAAEEATRARLLVATDLEQKAREAADLRKVLKQRDLKLGQAQKAQAELIRKQCELDDAKREMDLTIERKVQASLVMVRDRAKQEAEVGLKLKVLEREQQIASMQRQIEDLKRKAEQGSQQVQGEALELQLEALLRDRFPRDVIEPVPKGEFGGDFLHRVIGPLGQCCGTILWETKRTKNWSDAWLGKLRDDQRVAKALIVTHALPKGWNRSILSMASGSPNRGAPFR
jgi:hypothetical protein